MGIISLFYPLPQKVVWTHHAFIVFTACFSSLSHHWVFEFFTFTCIHLLAFLQCPVFTYWNTGFLSSM
jgi:hypothetical protein